MQCMTVAQCNARFAHYIEYRTDAQYNAGQLHNTMQDMHNTMQDRLNRLQFMTVAQYNLFYLFFIYTIFYEGNSLSYINHSTSRLSLKHIYIYNV